MVARELLETPLEDLCAEAQRLRAGGHGTTVTYSPKVFVPLTSLCRDVCHYCTFARPPRRGERAYMPIEEVVEIARRGAAAGCHEALFTLGDKPELRYRAARDELRELGCDTTLDYLARAAQAVLDETGLLPHLNPGLMSRGDLDALRRVAPSMGIMVETVSERLSERGGPHFGSPDKLPAARIATIDAAGHAGVPFTTGLLIGIGETRAERIETLLAIRQLGERHGHVQEVIVQNFRAKEGTKMAAAPEPELDDLLWTIAVARILLGPRWHVQCPPNLSYDDFPRLLDAGIDDWGGISPVTIDHVNPEAPWPEIELLRRATEERGLALVPRLALYPEYVQELDRWVDTAVARHVLRRADADGYAREDGWVAGAAGAAPPLRAPAAGAPQTHHPDAILSRFVASVGNRSESKRQHSVHSVLTRAAAGDDLGEDDVTALFAARGRDLFDVLDAADELRARTNGDEVSYVVTRNVNYTNVCYFRCGFCAFSKGKLAESLRGKPYLVPTDEILRRAHEAWERGAVEICLQGGIHPGFTGEYYLEVTRALKRELPELHIHAYSALEVWQGAATLGLPLRDYLRELRDAGLASLPGTAAEILDDDVRRVLCPDKVTTAQWLEVHETAHEVGLRSTATIMFGHLESTRSWARHLLAVRDLQRRTGGFTELVPLPFVHMEAPLYVKGRARRGPTFREALLMHAVARLALHPHVRNIQASWVKLGLDGASQALRSGVNDLGGTLMNESISRAAGASHGQELPPERMEETIRAAGRTPRQRTTLYGDAPPERRAASFGASPLAEPLNPPLNDSKLVAPPRLVRPGLAAARP